MCVGGDRTGSEWAERVSLKVELTQAWGILGPETTLILQGRMGGYGELVLKIERGVSRAATPLRTLEEWKELGRGVRGLEAQHGSAMALSERREEEMDNNMPER